MSQGTKKPHTKGLENSKGDLGSSFQEREDEILKRITNLMRKSKGSAKILCWPFKDHCCGIF